MTELYRDGDCCDVVVFRNSLGNVSDARRVAGRHTDGFRDIARRESCPFVRLCKIRLGTHNSWEFL